MTSAGFHAEATLDRANLMFFSVPYDDGFTAYVDGQETEILRVDEGLMAVPLPRRNGHHRLCLSARRHPPEPDCHPCRPARVPALHRVLCLGRKEKTEALKSRRSKKRQLKEKLK